MRWGVITFPGSNDDEQTAFVLERLLGETVVRLWHKNESVEGLDCVVLIVQIRLEMKFHWAEEWFTGETAWFTRRREDAKEM